MVGHETSRVVNSSPGSSLDLRNRQLSEVDLPVAWRRLAAAVAVGAIGSAGMWSIPVALPLVQADFGIARADASLPYTLAMMGFALGGVATGRLCDRFGVMVAIMLGTLALGIGFVGGALVPSLLTFALMHLFIGIGASATFGPVMAECPNGSCAIAGSRSGWRPPAITSAVHCGRHYCSMRWRLAAGVTPTLALECSVCWRCCRLSLHYGDAPRRIRSRGCRRWRPVPR